MTDNRKIVFLDIDGTLTEPGSNTPPESALDAIRGAQANGHLVFLCSGRSQGMLAPLLTYGFDGYVSSSGGYVVCGDSVIFDCAMDRETQDRVLDLLRSNGIFCTIEGREYSYTDEGFKEYLEANRDVPGNSELLRWRRQIESALGIRPMKEYQGEPIYKIVLLATDEDGLQNAISQLELEFNIVIQDRTGSGIINGEMQSKCFDKGIGVRKVCEYMGIPLENSIGFGDSMNDKEMMDVVGMSVCMENGSPALKSIADEVCDAVSNDGIYKAFVKYGLLTITN